MSDRPSPHASARAKRRRRAAEERAQAARVLVCDCGHDGGSPLRALVRGLGYETVPCTSVADAVRESARSPFDVVITALPEVNVEQVSLLQLLRRSLPGTPLVIVSEDNSLAARSLCQPVRPYYFAVPPLSENELRAILSGAAAAAERS
jgi:CheY-like chemotaxis protein